MGCNAVIRMTIIKILIVWPLRPKGANQRVAPTPKGANQQGSQPFQNVGYTGNIRNDKN